MERAGRAHARAWVLWVSTAPFRGFVELPAASVLGASALVCAAQRLHRDDARTGVYWSPMVRDDGATLAA